MIEDLDFQTWESLSAYLDGTLDGIAMAAVERAVRDDPELASALAGLRRQNAALRRWAADIGLQPVPPGVRALLDRPPGTPANTGPSLPDQSLDAPCLDDRFVHPRPGSLDCRPNANGGGKPRPTIEAPSHA